MSTGKSVNKIVSFLLALIFVATNTAYSSGTTLRFPITANTQQRIIEIMGKGIQVTGNTQFRIGYQPAIVVPDSIVTKTSTLAVAALTDAGLRGKARGLDKKVADQKAKIGEIKDAADGMAKRMYQSIIEEEGVVVNVHVSEGIGRDGLRPEDAFRSNEIINPTGANGTHHAIMDVIEGTNSFVTNVDGKRLGQLKDLESGATSIIATGAGIESLGNCPDSYVHYIGTTVPPEKMQEFTGKNALDPETIAKDPSKTEGILARIADANNIGIGDLEVVVMNRDREKQVLSVLAGLQKKYPGLKVVTIEDGTVAHSLEATFGRKEGKHKVVMTIGGAPEGFFNLAVAGLFKDQGALASMRIYSKRVNEMANGEKATDMAARYNFDEGEIADIQKMRSDGEAVLKGDRLFTQEDVKGDVEGSMAFITHNGVFGISGAEKSADGSYKVKVLRFGNIDGKPCAWFEEKTVIASSKAAGFELASSKLANGFEMREDAAKDVKGLLKNLEGVLELDTKGGVIVVNADKLRSETIDYLAKEAALNSNDDVKTAAQFLIRSAAISLGVIPASIHDFYMARKTNAWKNMTVPAVNIRTDGYETTRQVFRVVREQNIGAIILELAKSETRYSGQSVNEFTTVGFAAAIKEGYTGQIFFQGDHYQVDQKKYAKEPTKEIDTLKRFIRDSILAGEYNIDLDPSTLVNEEALDEIVVFENSLVDEYLKDHSGLTQGLDESGLKALRHKLIDELPLTGEQRTTLDALYERLHSDTAKVTMEFIRYIRGLEKELLDGKVTISIGIEERHIDNPKHKNNPSTVRGSIALAQKILKMCAAEGLVGPSKIALQTGTMHGLGGTVDFGIYERHLAAAPSLGIAVFVQHGASTIKDRGDFRKMPIGGVGEVHLATEYQKITLGIVARMMPDLAEKMAQYLEDLMAADPNAYGKKFGEKWAQAFNDPAQQGKSRHDIIVEILADELPGKLAGSLKDLTKELSGPFKNEIWNAPAPVREAMRQALYKEFSEIFQMLGARETRKLVESIIPVAKQPVVLAQRPEILIQAIAAIGKRDKGSPMHAWLAIVDAGYKASEVITDETFEILRMRYKKSTRGYEARSLEAAGIWKRVKGGYKLLVTATRAQIENEINPAARNIVNRASIYGEALGLDAHRLDPKWLGQQGNAADGNRRLKEIRTAVYKVTGDPIEDPKPLPYESEDFVAADIESGVLPASVLINDAIMPFDVLGKGISGYKGINDAIKEFAEAATYGPFNVQALLAALVDMRLVSDEVSVKREERVGNFEPTKVKTVLFKDTFVTGRPEERRGPAAFAEEFKKLDPDQIAVIISTSGDTTELAINEALKEAQLLEELGNRIIVMGVDPKSAAAEAFERLFTAGGEILRDLQTAKDILNNKDAVEGLAGAV